VPHAIAVWAAFHQTDRGSQSDMHVDHFNTLLSGGAAIAAIRLHAGLLQSHVGSTLWHAQPPYRQSIEGVKTAPWLEPKGSLIQSLGATLETSARGVIGRIRREYFRFGRRRRRGGFIPARNGRRTPYLASIFGGDIVHLHWIGKFIDYQSFFSTLPKTIPVVWTLHDMNPLTGGCSHAEDCPGFMHACGNCPLLARPGSRDWSFQELAIKRQAIESTRIHLVAPSHWMAEQARRSSIMQGFPVDVIRNPIDLSMFQPINRAEAKRQLGIPVNAPCLLYVSHSLKSKAKGIDEYLGALSQLRDIPGLTGLTFGRGNLDVSHVGVPIRCLGYLSDPDEQRIAYSAADVFVMPSHAETISQTIVEAFACNTPTVAFDVGGIPDLVLDGETGFLVPFRNVDGLAARIRWLLNHPAERDRMAANGAKMIRNEYSSEKSVKQYQALYERLLAKHDQH
jgi:glycosyltransferase involved in cell wall biosynthesis